MGDSIEEQEDEDEVWFPTEDHHDEYEPVRDNGRALELLQPTIITTPT